MSVLRCGDHYGVKVVRPIEHTPKVPKFFGLRITLRCGIQGELVYIAENRDILVRMRSFGDRFGLFGRAAARHEGEFTQVCIPPTATGNERNVQFIVEILAAENCRRRGDDSGRDYSTSKLTPRHAA